MVVLVVSIVCFVIGLMCFLIGEILGVNINWSLSVYLNNFFGECVKYKYNVDKDMLLLKFVDVEWGFVGFFSWFVVYGIFMNWIN